LGGRVGVRAGAAYARERVEQEPRVATDDARL